MMPLKRAFVALQERFVGSLVVACCPTMDLVAILTRDHHLLVHRTISWQKLLHIKPSDVGFEAVTVAWRPDGLQLAVGCDGGRVAIFEIESGEILPDRRSKCVHENCITAMHWAQISEVETSTVNSGNYRRRRKISEGEVDFSQSKLQFRRRSSRFLAGYSDKVSGDDTVLLTADDRGFIALWWMGRVLLTRIDVRTHFTEDEVQILQSMGRQRSDTSAFRIESVDLAPDLSLLFVLVVFSSNSESRQGDAASSRSQTKLHRMLTLDMTRIQHIHEDVALVASTVDCVHTILNRIVVTGRQLATEWKNATRIFELKMGLIGSLYEKYACEDPPQVDMLSVVVSGITAPALAQYFAQDIQEMSVHRMQKALFSGCETLKTLADEKLKRNLVDLLFLLSELRGHAKWSSKAFEGTLGITVDALDDLVTVTQAALVEVEALTLAIHKTRLDFALFFQWILERIRLHTNSTQAGGATGASGGNGTLHTSGSGSGSKSLLNSRRLCDFLHRAAKSAQTFRKQQPPHSIYKVETTFGNLVSRQLSTQSIPRQDAEKQAVECCFTLFKRIEDQWLSLLDVVSATFAQAIVRERMGCFTIGSSSDVVEECHVHFRQPFVVRKADSIAEYEEQRDGDEDEDEDEAVDWKSLKQYGPLRSATEKHSTIMMGFRLKSGNLLLLRTLHSSNHRQVQAESSPSLIWSSATVNFLEDSSSPATCMSFDFYGDVTSGKSEQLAFVLNRGSDGQPQQAWLYLQSYDSIEFTTLATSSTSTLSSDLFKAFLTEGTHSFHADRIRGRSVGPASPSCSGASVVATASRGVICVSLPPSRLTVWDAEDSEDEDDEGDNED